MGVCTLGCLYTGTLLLIQRLRQGRSQVLAQVLVVAQTGSLHDTHRVSVWKKAVWGITLTVHQGSSPTSIRAPVSSAVRRRSGWMRRFWRFWRVEGGERGGEGEGGRVSGSAWTSHSCTGGEAVSSSAQSRSDESGAPDCAVAPTRPDPEPEPRTSSESASKPDIIFLSFITSPRGGGGRWRGET